MFLKQILLINKFINYIHSHEQVFGFNFPPFRHDFEQGALDEIAFIIVINDSHKIPVKKPLP